MNKYIVIAILAVITLSSCVSKTMDAWVGQHQSKLIASWGPPTRTSIDGKGGSVLIYEKYVDFGQRPGTARTDGYGRTTYTAPQQRGYIKNRMFYVDQNGIIYSWRSRGL
jgi:hypothetical protein